MDGQWLLVYSTWLFGQVGRGMSMVSSPGACVSEWVIEWRVGGVFVTAVVLG